MSKLTLILLGSNTLSCVNLQNTMVEVVRPNEVNIFVHANLCWKAGSVRMISGAYFLVSLLFAMTRSVVKLVEVVKRTN